LTIDKSVFDLRNMQSHPDNLRL